MTWPRIDIQLNKPLYAYICIYVYTNNGMCNYGHAHIYTYTHARISIFLKEGFKGQEQHDFKQCMNQFSMNVERREILFGV